MVGHITFPFGLQLKTSQSDNHFITMALSHFLTSIYIALVIIIDHLSESVDAGNVHRIRDFNVFVPEEVTDCRMNCLVQFINNGKTNVMQQHDPCTDRPDCFMCWDFCRILYTEKTTFGELMCNNPVLCVNISNIFF